MTQLNLATEKIQARVDNTGIGWIVFNNPERHNAMSLEMWQGLGDSLDQFGNNSAVRVVVMRGAGEKAFISGADISEFDSKRGSAAQKASYEKTMGRSNRSLSQFGKPLIALIEGYCIGGGLATALHADIRIATPDSSFGIPAARLGLGYDYAGLAKLARVVGPANARDIMFSARFMQADAAFDMGLINFIHTREDIESATSDYASRIASNAPLTVAAAKAALNAWEAGERKEAMADVVAMVNACFDSEDYKEGRRAFKEKRTPDFKGR
jgi:enoyl-CoA hydratase